MKARIERPAALETRSLSSHVGVEVCDVDPAGELAGPCVESLRQLLARHHLLLFRGVEATPPAQERFARLFGTTALREQHLGEVTGDSGQYVSNHREGGIFGDGELDFHMDQLFHEHPLRALILYALEVPATGGDTLFVNAQAAYDRMPADLRERVDTLHCEHARAYPAAVTAAWNVNEAAQDGPRWTHPMAPVDLASGRRALWVNKLTTVGVRGLEPSLGRDLCARVRGHLYDPDLTYRHRWTAGDLVLWNNHTLQHAREPFEPGVPRTLRRTAIL